MPEISPDVFANTPVSAFFRDRAGGLRNAALFWGGEHVLKSAAELGYSVKTGKSSFEHVYAESFWDRMRRLPDDMKCSIARWQTCAATNTSGSPGPTTGPA